jgi:hypothetical protein
MQPSKQLGSASASRGKSKANKKLYDARSGAESSRTHNDEKSFFSVDISSKASKDEDEFASSSDQEPASPAILGAGEKGVNKNNKN